MAFTLPDLPYAHDALAAGGMSKETLEYHHDKHHKAYVDKLNELIAGTEWESKTLEEIVKGFNEMISDEPAKMLGGSFVAMIIYFCLILALLLWTALDLRALAAGQGAAARPPVQANA